MNLHRYRIKIFGRGEESFSPAEIVPVFHEWIRSDEFDELLIDVGDYKHVPGGPGIVLVGLESDYSVDNSGGRWGLSYVRKRVVHPDVAESLAASIQRVAFAATRLQLEPALEGRIRFDNRTLEVTFLDRLVVRNDEEGLLAASPPLKRALEDLLGTGPARLGNVEQDPRRPLRLRAEIKDGLNLNELAQEAGADTKLEVST